MDIGDDAGALDRILGSLPSFVLLIDHEGVVRYINRLEPGFVRSDVVGQPARSFITRDTDALFQSALRSVLDTGEPTEYTARAPLPDGSIAWYRTRVRPLWDGDTVTHVVLISTNVTELKKAQDEVERLRGLLPMCAWCERIQADDGSWVSVEDYLGRKTGTRITHGMCPDCYRRQFASGGSDEG